MLSILHNVRRGIGAQVMRVIDHAHFALNKFKNLSITLLYNALPLIICNHASHTSSIKPNPCTNLSQNHMHSCLQHSLIKFLKDRKSLLTFTCIARNVIFLSHRSYLTSEAHNTTYLSFSHTYLLQISYLHICQQLPLLITSVGFIYTCVVVIYISVTQNSTSNVIGVYCYSQDTTLGLDLLNLLKSSK